MLLKVLSQPLLTTKRIKLNQTIRFINCLNGLNSSLSFINQYPFSSTSQLLQFQLQTTPHLYTQRALNPSEITKQLISQLPTTPLTIILHQLSLYHSKLLPFDYDYFVESLKWILPHQNHLSLSQLLMFFDLAIQYKIDSGLLLTHFQNQLYCRVYLMTKKEIGQYDVDVKNQLEQTYNFLEKGSADHFNLISQQFKQLLQEEDHQDKEQRQEYEEEINSQNQQNTLWQQDENHNLKQQDKKHTSQQQKKEFTAQQQSTTKTKLEPKNVINEPQNIINKPTYNASQRKIKSKTLQQQLLNRITHIFLDSNSRHIEFNNLLLQINTIRLDQYTKSQQKKASKHRPDLIPSFLLTYTRLTTHLLQLYMTEYQSAVDASTKTQSPKYTRRSVKHIYKVQAFYYYEMAKLVEEKKLLEGATDDELASFIQIVSGFPIKRRSFRKAIGDVLIDEAKRRQLPFDSLIKFFQLSKFDNKLLDHFQNKINGIVKLPGSKKPSIQQLTENQLEQDQSAKTLVPQVIDESIKQDEEKNFKMPAQLFRKVTKKKSKPKNHKFVHINSEQIDLTQQDITDAQTVKDSHLSDEHNKKCKTLNDQVKEKQEMTK